MTRAPTQSSWVELIMILIMLSSGKNWECSCGKWTTKNNSFHIFCAIFFGFIFLILVKARQFYLIHCSILTVKKYLLQRWQWLLKSSRLVHTRTRARQPSRQYDNMVWCHKDNDKNPESGAPPATRSHPFCNHRVLGLAKFWITLYYNFCEYRPASLTAQLIIP